MKQLRKNILRIALLLCGLFVLLAGYGAYSIATYGNRWFASTANTFVRTQKKNVIAGDILDRNGVVLATTRDGQRVYAQDAAVRKATVHVVGDSGSNVNNGAESFFSAYLYGFNMSFLERLGCAVKGQARQGDNVQLTIDSTLASYVASIFPSGKSGAVVVMNYKNGEVLTQQSFPNFDPQNITASVKEDAQKPFYNRAVQGLYAPGSTFKVVTAESALVVENSSYPTANRTDREIAWTGAGQSALVATPMHMCMIAAGVANGGVMMEPRMLKEAVAQNGTVRAAFAEKVYRRVMPAQNADLLKEYMRAVVTGGTGTRAAISGVKVCGKTGSAELDNQENTNAWFIGFLDEPDAPYAIAIVVEDAGGGGSVAAPVARQIFQWLLGK